MATRVPKILFSVSNKTKGDEQKYKRFFNITNTFLSLLLHVCHRVTFLLEVPLSGRQMKKATLKLEGNTVSSFGF